MVNFFFNLYYTFYRLDLDTWINEPPSESSEDEEYQGTDVFIKSDKHQFNKENYYNENKYEPTEEELQKVCNKFVSYYCSIFYRYIILYLS